VLISRRCRFHGVDIGVPQHEPGADTARWTDSTEQIGRLVALIAWRSRSSAAFRPDAGQAALLTNPRFILPPQFDRLTLTTAGFYAGFPVFVDTNAPVVRAADGVVARLTSAVRRRVRGRFVRTGAKAAA
jgi:hypothetical protein